MRKKLWCMLLSAGMLLAILPAGQHASAAVSLYAEPATDAELEAADNIVTRAGIGVQIINGSLYVWGRNNNARLGIMQTVDPDTKETIEVNVNDKIKWPTEISRAAFGGNDVVKVFSGWTNTFAITSAGELYGWGVNGNRNAVPQSSETQIRVPTKITAFDGKQVLSVNAAETRHAVAKVKEPTGEINWYAWGANGYGQCGTGATGAAISEPHMLAFPELAGETIKEIQTADNVMVILTESGKVYGVGRNENGQAGNNFGLEQDEAATDLTPGINTANVLKPSQIDFGGKTIKQIRGSARSLIALDEDGCVWTWGSSAARYGLGLGALEDKTLGEEGRISKIGKPMKVFGKDSINENTSTKKARYIWGMSDAVVVLCTDNTLFGWGYRGRRFINNVDELGYVDGYPYPTQILKTASQQSTIVNVISDDASFTAITRSGDSFFAGSNANGGSGDKNMADNTIATPETGSAQEMPDLPPVKPTTLNKVYMDVTYADRDDENNAIKTISGAAGQPVTANVDAGQKFTVKVYFEDFAKLDQFILPIKFSSEANTGKAKVVYKSGSGDEYKAYSGDPNEPRDGSNIVEYNSKSGLVSNVKESVWPGGELLMNDSYPRVNNDKGYLSVYGRTTTANAPIVGKQLMFSVEFIGTSNGEITFWIPDAEENIEGGDPILAEERVSGLWHVLRQTASGKDLDSYFPFNNDAASFFPKLDVAVHPLVSMGLLFVFEKDGKQYSVTDKVIWQDEADETKKRDYFVIDRDGTDNTYFLKTNPNPINATEADISSWTVEFDDLPGAPPEGREISDFVELVQEGTKSYAFKIQSRSPITDTAYLKFTAANKDVAVEPIYVKITSMDPPESITIDNKEGCPDPFLVNEPVRGLDLASEYTFDATVHDDKSTGNTSVTWTLYNCVTNDDGTVTEAVIANNDKTAPAVIAEVIEDAKTPTIKSARIAAQRTTQDGSFVKLRIASTASGEVYDETTFRVELLATSIVAGESIFIGKSTSRLLNITADPYDAYKPEYEITLKANETSHGSYITVNADGTISAGGDVPEDPAVYDTVVVREKKSDAFYSTLEGGNTMTVREIRVYVVNIVPPPNMEVVAENNVGILNDRVVIKKDLKEGDSLKIYKEFMNAGSLVKEYPALTKSQINELAVDGYLFIDEATPENSGLSGTGGTVGYLVTRQDEVFTEVPVTYSAEPCMLTGYARLEGRMDNSSQNADITVEIMGLRDADGNPIPPKQVMDETGYFEFENYVPVGNYTIKISRDLYITRYVTVTVTGTSTSSDIVVSTVDRPIYLSPGDLGNPKNGKLDPAEFNSYLYNWFGKSGSRADTRFYEYNFVERSSSDNTISIFDVGLLLRYYNRDDVYSNWTVKQ